MMTSAILGCRVDGAPKGIRFQVFQEQRKHRFYTFRYKFGCKPKREREHHRQYIRQHSSKRTSIFYHTRNQLT